MCIYPMDSPGGYQLVGRTLPIWNTFGRTGPFTPHKPWLLEFFDQVNASCTGCLRGCELLLAGPISHVVRRRGSSTLQWHAVRGACCAAVGLQEKAGALSGRCVLCLWGGGSKRIGDTSHTCPIPKSEMWLNQCLHRARLAAVCTISSSCCVLLAAVCPHRCGSLR
jgi:hypothetical protein